MSQSRAQLLASLSDEKRKEFLEGLSEKEAEELQYLWEFWARPDQLEPGTPGAPETRTDWLTWLPLAGRGWGKSRVGAEFIRSNVCGSTPLTSGGYERVALVAETAADARDVMVEGESGILSVHPPDYRPQYEPSKRKLTWPNGATGHLYNATEPDQLRGPQNSIAWCDELAKWQRAEESWDMLQFGLRLGTRPKQVVTTTPRPIPLLRRIMEDDSTIVTRHSTYENLANLPPSFIKQIQEKYGGTRLGRQELEAEVLDDAPGALWTRNILDDYRLKSEDELPEMQRIVVGVDPSLTSDDEGAAETGIVTAGLGVNGHAYILDDLSGHLSPSGWGKRATSVIHSRDADAIVAEINQGGDMVERTLRSAEPNANVIKVRASRGKITRAEPIAALYEQGRVHHVGVFSELEDQMMLFTPEGIEGDARADRVDALVWALTALFEKITKSQGRKKKVEIQGLKEFNAFGW